MAMWFFVLGLPLVAWGLFSLVTATGAARALVAFPRSRAAGRILCAVGWFWTAYECDMLGIDVFDKFLKAFPGELWILAAVLTVLTCWWMENLLPIRGVSALFMLFPGEMFPMIRLCETPWRLTLVVFAYVCALAGCSACSIRGGCARRAHGWRRGRRAYAPSAPSPPRWARSSPSSAPSPHRAC